jgi:hypothetical protein
MFIYGIWKHGAIDGETPPEWDKLREIVRRNYKVETFMDLDDILIKGQIIPELKDWMVNHYNVYKNHPDHNEMKSLALYYFVYLHPEEATEAKFVK